MKNVYKILVLLFIWNLYSCSSKDNSNIKTETNKTMNKDLKIDNFWKWFSKKSYKLKNYETNPDRYLEMILKQARKIEDGLAFEIEPPINNIIRLTISADGDFKLFNTVKRIKERAPIIEGWEFVAFRQRVPKVNFEGLVLKSEEIELDASKLMFYPIIDRDKLDIIVYLEGITEENYNFVAYGCLTLIDNILGEYDCVTKVRHYDFQQIPTEQSQIDDLIPLVQLAEYVDEYYNKK